MPFIWDMMATKQHPVYLCVWRGRGFLIQRHNELRDLEAEMLEDDDAMTSKLSLYFRR